MRLIRVILQILIVIIGGLAVSVFLDSREFIGAFFFIGFTAVLLAFTNIIKDQTEKRLSGVSLDEQNYTALRAVLSLLGGFGVYLGLKHFFGIEPLPDGFGGCRAICGVILLARQAFGDSIGQLVAGFLWTVGGLSLIYIGFKNKRT
jgi:uncharacterized SAM-binding protein YcdF (DUF218 family)